MAGRDSRLIIDVLTLFPAMFDGPMTESLLGRAQKNGLINIRVHSLRRWSTDVRHQKVDDRPFGGGAGMIIQAEPLYRALKELGALRKKGKPWVIALSPQGKVFTQQVAMDLSKKKHLILICGHYEGIDERIMSWVDQEISIGDYVLTGGEIPALVVADGVARLVPGVVKEPESLKQESFSNRLLDYPHFTRPRVWRGKKVPQILLSGNHQSVAHWRQKKSFEATQRKRPDLMKRGTTS